MTRETSPLDLHAMKNCAFKFLAVFTAVFTSSLHAEVIIDKATLTEVVNSVSIIDRSTKKTSSAKVQQVLNAPNILRTGADSRAELIAPDQTVTRVGQNTLFSFQQDSREINLEKGSLLFQSPSGKGGGTINAPAASAAVLGTTLIVTTTKNGGFKVLLLEGKGKVKPTSGPATTLRGGQMVYALPGGKLSKVFTFQLSQQVAISKLVSSFKKKLPSSEKIDKAIAKQEKEIASGEKVATNLLASDSPEMALQVDVAQDVLERQLFGEEEVTPFQKAIASDAIVDSPELDSAFLFTFNGANLPELESPPVSFGGLGESHHSSLLASDAAIFIANNIFFRTPTVNLSSFNGRSIFQFIAINDINIEQSLTLSGLTTTELNLIAGNTFVIAPDTTITTDSKHFAMISMGSQFELGGDGPATPSLANLTPLEAENLTLLNTNGSLSILAGESKLKGLSMGAKERIHHLTIGDLSLDSSVNFNPVTVSAAPPTSYDVAKLPSGLNKLKADSIQLRSGRNINIKGFGSEAKFTSAVAEGDITLKAVYLCDLGGNKTGSVFSPNPTVHMRSGNLMDITGAFFDVSDVHLQARTLNLRDVRFQDGSRVILESATGGHTIGQANARPGHVNFISNVFYGSVQVDSNFDSGSSSINAKNNGGSQGILVQKQGSKPSNSGTP